MFPEKGCNSGMCLLKSSRNVIDGPSPALCLEKLRTCDQIMATATLLIRAEDVQCSWTSLIISRGIAGDIACVP